MTNVEKADSVSKSKDESIDTVQRPIHDAVRNPPICYKCLSDMGPKKGHVLPDGGNMVTWVCRECGHKVEIDDGQKRVKPVHDGEKGSESMPLGNDAFDWFFRDVFGMYRVAKSGSETAPKSVKEG